MRTENIFLAGTGAYIPPRVSVDEAVRRGAYDRERMDSCGWRNIAVADGMSAPDMAVAAVRQAVDRSGLGRDDIDILVHSCAYHQGPDGWSAPHYILRSTLDSPIPALTVEQGCNAFLAALEMATQYLLCAPSRTGAVVSSADNFGAPSVDRWYAHRDAVLADAATAVVLSKQSGWAALRSIESVSLPQYEILNRGHDPIFPPAVTTGRKLDMNEHLEAMVDELGPKASEIGQEYAASGAKLIGQVTDEAGVAVADLSKVLHLGAGTTDFLDSHLRPMGLDASLGAVDFFRDVGHAGAADIGLQLNHLVEDGQVSAGDHLLLLSAGPGLMITAAVVTVLEPPPGAPRARKGARHDEPGSPEGEAAAGAEEPIAVVGLSCRYPGDADSPDAFWDLLVQGRDGIGDGAERWAPYADTGHEHAAVVRDTTSRGGFLADIAGFDAEFFGISPREAELMDPQQRLLLELAWEALEHAGIPPLGLGGSDCGVFVGVGSDDYGRRLLEDLARIEAWTGIGAAMCATANRISHSLDLRGPSLAVDTACSASLVGVHLARRSLLSGESDVALAAGVNLMVAPGLSVTLDRAGATSPDGRSKPFDASADGYGRGEGAGVLVLKRLSDAERAGDRVLAVIRGSGVSQDGRTAGIMAPNGEAQADLLRRTYTQCGIGPDTVDYVEAHGTGTVAGDPLEAGALAAVFGAGRPEGSPCLIGSVKGNIGHLEAGSGIAGMIKTILALVHEEIPPSVHFSAPNPRIPWGDSGLRVTQGRTPWRRGSRPRRAGVSSFGYGGTIAHVVLEEAPARPEPSAASGDNPALPRLFPLSGRSGTTVREDAARLAGWLNGPGTGVALASLAQDLTARRSHLERRVAVVAADHAELESRLRRFAAGDTPPGLTEGTVAGEGGDRVVWVFSGTGAQWKGMGRELLATDTVFAEVIDRIGPVFAEEIGTTARRMIEDGDITRVDIAQTMIYAVQMGLVAVWQSLGVSPAAVIGHSMGRSRPPRRPESCRWRTAPGWCAAAASYCGGWPERAAC